MNLGRTYRLGEASLTLLFLIQAFRLATGRLLLGAEQVLTTGEFNLAAGRVLAALLVAVVLPWFSPTQRHALPETLSISAIVVALARAGMSVQVLAIQVAAALVVVAAGSIYLASLLRARWQTWLSAWIVALSIDQALRAYDSFDLTLHSWLRIRIVGVEAYIPWLSVQIVLVIVVIVLSRLARGEARHEPYKPAHMPLAGGAALGGFLVLELVVLAVPNVMARWTSVSRAGIVLGVMLATVAPLVPLIRRQVGSLLRVFNARVQGLVWVILLMLFVVAGNRLIGIGAVIALLLAQLMAVMLLWWLFVPADDQNGPDRTGPAITLGMAIYFVLVCAYGLTIDSGDGVVALHGQAPTILLSAAALLGVPRLLGRTRDPWQERLPVPMLLTGACIIPILVLVTGLAFSGRGRSPEDDAPTLRVATYNLNHGYDASETFTLEAAARTIGAARPDVVLLQEVDVGWPTSYGVDEVAYLARQLRMHAAFFPISGREQGLAVLSVWPLGNVNGSVISAGRDDAVLAVRVEQAGSTVTYIDVALTPGTEEEELQQLAVLLGMFGEDDPAVVGGTLAPPEQSLVYQQLTLRGFVDPATVLGADPAYTYSAVDPDERHDYLLAQRLIPLDARQVESVASDHRLVVVELGWPMSD